MMNVPYVVLKYATLLLSFPINNVVEVVLTTLTAVLKSTIINPHFLQGIKQIQRMKTVFTNTPRPLNNNNSNITLFSLFIIFWL